MQKHPFLSDLNYELPDAGRPGEITRRSALRGAASLAMALGLPALLACSSTAEAEGAAAMGDSGNSTQPVPTGTITSATINVPSTTSVAVPSKFVGLSYEKQSLSYPIFTGSNTNLITLFKLLGPSILRLGGNSVDSTVWAPSGTGGVVGQTAPADVDALAAFLSATGWQCLYGINLYWDSASGDPPSPPQTTALAKEEIAYVTTKLGSSLMGIEIGNEPDMYDATGSLWAADASNWLVDFESVWDWYRSAIQSVASSTNFTGPATAGANHATSFTKPFAQHEGSNISLMTQHYYRNDAKYGSISDLISYDSQLVSCLSTLSSVGTPFRLTEANSYYNGGDVGVSNAYCSALWVLDFLFTVASAGATGVNMHSGTASYTPLTTQNTGAVTVVRPEFYGMYFFSLLGTGRIVPLTTSFGGLNVTAYGIFGSNIWKVVVINKDSTHNLQVTLTVPQTVTSALLLEMTQLSSGASTPDLSATSGVTVQGSTINTNGTLSPALGAAYQLSYSGAQVTCYAPLLSAVLIRIQV